MKNSNYLLFFLFSILFTYEMKAEVSDTCLINDECSGAILISNVYSDSSFVCLQGCNLFASPDSIVSECQMADFPSVWYQVNTDASATLLNIEVQSQDFDAPSIAVYKGSCGGLIPVNLVNGNLSCIIGENGFAKAIGTRIDGSASYYIAVGSVYSIGGSFDICVSTIANGSYCVLERGFNVVARSNGGSLEGPFDPGEKISVCVNIDSYTAVGNGCQWFQGIVPVFGNGWDPTSFLLNGQPYNAKVNDTLPGIAGNGIYGASTWDWFNDVGYHHNNPNLSLGDYDNNGRMELCNSSFEMNCPVQDSLHGGCCGPCWDDAGDVLPGGWFAYGINGTCGTAGPPIALDWGDGNTCGCCMGPWKFCFDLLTRDTPDCLGDSTKQDLTIGFYTFADGEIGSWTGGASVCALDQPLKLTLNALCGRIITPEPEILPNLNSEDIFSYQIYEPSVDYWEWNISPYLAIPHDFNKGPNGSILEYMVFNSTGSPIDVVIVFIGHVSGSEDLIIKKVYFTVNPWTTATSNLFDDQSLKIVPNPASNYTLIDWSEDIGGVKQLMIYNANGSLVKRIMIDNASSYYNLDLSLFQSGIYFIHVVTRKKVYAGKLIKY